MQKLHGKELKKGRLQKQLDENTEKRNVIKKTKLKLIKINFYYIILLSEENIDKKKGFFILKMSYLTLPFRLVRKEEKIKLDLPKNYGASQYIRGLPYVSREDPSF